MAESVAVRLWLVDSSSAAKPNPDALCAASDSIMLAHHDKMHPPPVSSKQENIPGDYQIKQAVW